ncbi:winged helix-turn-helix transcriptional regulator [Larkinella humicola]|uniref:Helix-turn-helix transcriptional regulator n=1 Tax=Larkinella humicola TaxID=2607654 RepID=A0A5N1JBU9_9BACT|nr:helix-turn-helix domain-containing protein [Larkinella humicola]KAA9349244.1 helix-turn-helix transcriptional regulator [Larkinella humicola]
MQKLENSCPAEELLKLLSGKLKPQIFQLALNGPLRFNTLLREIAGANKQSLAVALKELVDEGYLEKEVIRQKPLHIEYMLSERGKALIPVFQQLEKLQ